ncbi:hypothetical protein BBJ28_00014106 [Nothophytophthora sp. Chile5]|nr:hypothetical protein BBJ28_00014106 [Nothophytophthora sp. Chile5]
MNGTGSRAVFLAAGLRICSDREEPYRRTRRHGIGGLRDGLGALGADPKDSQAERWEGKERAGQDIGACGRTDLVVVDVLLSSVKNGKVVVLLNGRFAGRKAIVVKTYDEGRADRKFGHAIGTKRALTLSRTVSAVAGIDRYPRKVTRAMGKNKLKKKSKVKPFVKYVNYNHIMPTRYVADIDLKKVLDDEVLANPETRIESRKTIKKVFEERYVLSPFPGTNVLCFRDLEQEPEALTFCMFVCRLMWCSYLNQAACKSEKKAAGVSFFFKKLRF